MTGRYAIKAVAFGLALLIAPSAQGDAATPAPPPPVTLHFEVAMVRGTLWNPGTGRNDPVELRSYRGEGIRDGDFVAPTIRVRPGQTLRLHLDNNLPACSEAQRAQGPCPNDTNIHTHGLWISPAGNSDNVMISIPPGGRFDYEFRIPDEHPAGTFWYHPHRHGSGMYQIGSGMAGALIVEGNRLPTAERPGDVDILLKDERGRPFPERILVLQSIPYACSFDDEGFGRRARDAEGRRVGPYLCDPGEVGRIESDTQLDGGQPTPPGRFRSINGKVQPELSGAVAGGFERWRIVAATTHEGSHLHFRRLAPEAPQLSTVAAAEQPGWVERYCSGPDLPVWQIAHDGLTRPDIRKTDESVLAPSNRLDLLTWFPEPGRYCLLNLDDRERAPTVLSTIQVSGRASRANPDTELERLLVRSAQRALGGNERAAIRARVIADLENGLRLGAFVAHRTIAASEVTGRQAVEFRTVGSENRDFRVDGQPFDPDRIRFLPLGGVEEWRLSVPSDGGRGHSFHIHVNPFQIVSIQNERGEDLTDPASPAFEPDYAGLTGVWRDTIQLKPGAIVIMRTRYERFIGDAMLHCHNARHHDLGLRQHIRIYLPGSPEGPVAPQHEGPHHH